MNLNHALSDGIGFMHLLLELQDNSQPEIQFPHHKTDPWWKQFLLHFLLPYAAVKSLQYLLRRNKDPNPILDDQMLSGQTECAFSQTIKLNEFKQAAKQQGATINDLIMACMAKATKKYFLLQNCYDETNSIFTYMPVSMRSNSEHDMRNRVTFIPLNLPLPSSLDNSATELITKIQSEIKY